MAHAGAVKGWTGGGLHAPDDPANTAGANSPCFLTLRASPAGFAVDQAFTHPTDGIFNCDAANAVPVTGFSR
jgi:hypothetical protein